MSDQSSLLMKFLNRRFQGFYGWTDTLKGIQYGPGSLSTALPKASQPYEPSDQVI